LVIRVYPDPSFYFWSAQNTLDAIAMPVVERIDLVKISALCTERARFAHANRATQGPLLIL